MGGLILGLEALRHAVVWILDARWRCLSRPTRIEPQILHQIKRLNSLHTIFGESVT